MIRVELIGRNLYQWDLDRCIEVTLDPDVAIDEIHASGADYTEAHMLKLQRKGTKVTAIIPNILLQSDNSILIFFVQRPNGGRRTVGEYTFSVKSRPKPDDYVYTETEVESYYALEERIKALEQGGGASGDPGEDGGYYIPNVSQVDENTMSVSFVASKEGMPAIEEQQITLPSGKPGADAPQEAVLFTPQDLTDEQKAQARQNIGVDGASGGGFNDNPLELIAEITLEKETFSVIFDKDANGEPLELEDFELVTIARSNVVGTGTTSGHLFLNGAMFSGPLVAFKSEDTTAEAYRTLRYFNAGQAVLHGRVVSNTTLATGANSQFFMKVINRPITSVGVRPSAAADRFIAGSNFKLYGRKVKK